jgi:hypothetical protein
MVTAASEIGLSTETEAMNFEPAESIASNYGPHSGQNPTVVPEDTRPEHRCRLFRTVRDVLPGQDMYVEVWDSVLEPQDVSRLPIGSELVASFQHASAASVHDHVVKYREQHGYRLRGNWNFRGSL